MPDKDGDEGKSTKSVVNKKQKQMMGEEGYDIARDMGRVRPSKDKKDATTMPPSKEMEKTRKVNKGPSALDIVKKKYKGQIMKMEELDLTKVAEAFGGYIVEQTDQGKKKKQGNGKNTNDSPRADRIQQPPKDALDYTDRVVKNLPKQERPEPVQKAMAKDSILRQRGSLTPDRDAYLNPDGTLRVNPNIPNKSDDGTQSFGGPVKVRKVDPETLQPGVNPTGEIKRGRPIGTKDKTKRYVAKNPSKKDEVIAAMTPGQRERNIRKEKREIDAKNPTIQTQVGPVPYRNQRVATTSALVPQYDRIPKIMKPDTKVLNKLSPNVKTSFFQPTVGALPLTQTDFNKIVPFRRGKPFTDFVKDVSDKTTVIPPDPQREKGGGMGQDTGRTVDAKFTVIPDKPPEIKGFKNFLPPPEQNKKSAEPETETDKGGDPPKGKTKVGTATPGKGPFSRVRAFARRNPVLSLVGYDALKNFKVPSVTKPTKTGRVSAGS